MQPPLFQPFKREEGHIFSVSDFLDVLNEVLVAEDVFVQGEVSGLKSFKKFIKFDLKDKEDGSILRCAMWLWTYKEIGMPIKEGMEVKVGGHPEIYKPWGELHFRTKTLEPIGEGALKQAYELLKKELEKEGLFARKRPLPSFIEKIGLITSKSGVVIHDFMKNLNPLGFQISFVDSRMEGRGAVSSVVGALEWLGMHRRDLDVLVLIRGGGSLESMQAFNNEKVVRAIFASQIPVLCGIGHEVDVPIACLAADVSVSTPTAAAIAVNQSWDSLRGELPHLQGVLLHIYERWFTSTQSRVQVTAERIFSKARMVLQIFGQFEHAIRNALDVLCSKRKEIEEKTEMARLQLMRRMDDAFREKKQLMERSQQYLLAVSPERNLRLGYSIIWNGQQKVVKNVENLRVGEIVSARVAQGEFSSQVQKIEDNHYE